MDGEFAGPALHEFGGALEDGEVLVGGEEVKGVDGDAVATDAEARVKGLEAKGLAAGGRDHLVWVDAMHVAGVAHLVDVGDVDHPVAVLKQLRHLSHLRPGHGHDRLEDARVDGDNLREGTGGQGRDDLGYLGGRRVDSAGIDALGRHAAVEKVFVGGEELPRGADRDGALDDDAGTGLGMLEDRLDGQADEVEVHVAVILEVGGHGDEVMGGTSEGGGLAGQLDRGEGGKVRRQFLEALFGDVEADAVEQGAELLQQGFANEADADDADADVGLEGPLRHGLDVLHCVGRYRKRELAERLNLDRVFEQRTDTASIF